MIKLINIPLLVLSIYSVNSIADSTTCLPVKDYTEKNFDAVVESVSLGYRSIENKSTYLCVVHLKNLDVRPMKDISVVPIISTADASIISTNQLCSYFSTIYQMDRILKIRVCEENVSHINYLQSVEFKRFEPYRVFGRLNSQ